jgi:hypothetical protein
MSWTHPPARLLAMVRTADMVLRGKQFVSRPPRLPREAPQCTQPLAPNSRLQLHRDSLSRRTEVWWSRARSPIYRHPGAPRPPPPPSCCFDNWRKREHCGCRNLSVRPSVSLKLRSVLLTPPLCRINQKCRATPPVLLSKHLESPWKTCDSSANAWTHLCCQCTERAT